MTKKEREYLDRVANLGCIVCKKNGYHTEPEIHHLREGMGMGQRNDYLNAIPLCPIHHRTGGVEKRSMRVLSRSLRITEQKNNY